MFYWILFPLTCIPLNLGLHFAKHFSIKFIHTSHHLHQLPHNRVHFVFTWDNNWHSRNALLKSYELKAIYICVYLLPTIHSVTDLYKSLILCYKFLWWYYVYGHSIFQKNASTNITYAMGASFNLVKKNKYHQLITTMFNKLIKWLEKR